MQSWWNEWSHLVDASAAAVLFWALFRALRQRRRSYRVLVGLVLLGLCYVLTNAAGLPLASVTLLGLLAMCAIVAVLTLEDDLRRALESLAIGKRVPLPDGVNDTLVRATSRMAEASVGALIILPGKESLMSHISGGVPVDAMLSEPLLLSLFDPGSPGHDGALIVQGARVERFAVHLPLSRNERELDGRGTRHASALGISECSDCVCIVVSEERGQISVAQQGKLQVVDEAGLRTRIARHAAGRAADGSSRRSVVSALLEFGLAAFMATLLWFAVIPGGVVVSRVVRVPVQLESLPEGYELERPLSVEITLSGPRRAIYLLSEQQVEVALDAWFVGAGKRVFVISPRDVRVPLGIDVLDVYPRHVELRVRHAGAG
jgi:diadenylate cyclase